MAVDGPAEVGGEDEASLEDDDEDEVPVLVLLGDLRAELLHPGGNLLGGQHRDEAFAHGRLLSRLDAPGCKDTTGRS